MDENRVLAVFSKWLNEVEASRGGLRVTPGEVTERFLLHFPQYISLRVSLRRRARELINWRGGEFHADPKKWK